MRKILTGILMLLLAIGSIMATYFLWSDLPQNDQWPITQGIILNSKLGSDDDYNWYITVWLEYEVGETTYSTYQDWYMRYNQQK